MEKKGQATVFMIVSVIALIALGILIYTSSQYAQLDRLAASEAAAMALPVQSFVEECIKEVGKEGIAFVGKRGGYFELPELSDELMKSAYYLYREEDLMLSKDRLESEISRYINSELFFCLKNFADLDSMGFEIKQGEINAATLISKNNVAFNVKFALSVSKGNLTRMFDSFFAEIDDIRLGTVYDTIRQMMDLQMEDPSSVCLSCWIESAIENDLMVKMYDMNDEDILFEVEDNNSIVSGEPYVFRFINKYVPASSDETEELDIAEIPDRSIPAGYEFIYAVSAEGSGVRFSDETDLFDINPQTGLIKFKPLHEQAGTYIIAINAEDAFNNTDTEMFTLEITSFNNPPVLDYIGYLTAKAGQLFTYDVNATDADGHRLYFVADTSLFAMDEDTGLIRFTPNAGQKGSYNINISVSDELGAVDVEKMGLIITD